MLKLIIGLSLLGAALYFAAMGALYGLQRKVLYIPPNIYLQPADVTLKAVEIFDINTPESLDGWWIEPATTTAPVVMFFHGNGSAIYSNHEIYRELASQGYGVFALAYPGYPGTQDNTTQDSLTAAAIDGYGFIQSQGITDERIVYYGTSLGGGVAAQLSTYHPPALLIIESSFTSAADMAQYRFPVFPAAKLTKDKFYSNDALADANISLLWMHGTADRVIPFHIGQKLFEGYDGPKTGHVIDKGRHTDLWYRGGREIIFEALKQLE